MNVNVATLARFRRYAIPQESGCWKWTGPQSTRDGYGTFLPAPGQRRVMAHRWSYEAHRGAIPDGMDLDHVCHTSDAACPGGPGCPHRLCVNPAHLEPVTRSENILRSKHAGRQRTHCPKGHEYAGDNLMLGRDGKRRCRQCDRDRPRRERRSTAC